MVGSKYITYLPLHACYFIYSIFLVIAKFAGEHPLFSVAALGLYCLAFFLLGIFALVWQQVLKRIPLTIAYSNRAITILYGMIWGAVLFAEEITWNMILGTAVIVAGVVLVVTRRG